MRPLRVAFFGTPAFALTALERLHASSHTISLVVTQPDRPHGRGQRLTPGPVKTFAVASGLPVLQPERLKDDEFLSTVAGFNLDLAVVVAYGRILPGPLLAVPRLGTINVHASLLPRWRGAAPVHRAILAGDTETGVTIMRVVPALDAGPLLASTRVHIDRNETSEALERRLAEIGAGLLVATVDRLSIGPVAEEAQDEATVTYASRLERRESRVDWDRPASAVHNQIRGLQPWPVATVLFGGKRLLLLESVVNDQTHTAPPGTVLEVDRTSFVVACGSHGVRILRVQLEGRGPVAVGEFLNGHHLTAGDLLQPLDASP